MKNKLFAFLLMNKLLIAVNLLGLYLFSRMTESVADEEQVLAIDRWISMHIDVVRTSLLTKFMVIVTDFNGAMGIFVLSAAMVLFLIYKKWYNDVLFYIFSVSGANIAFVAIKIIVQRLRPDSNILFITSYSFPSGHATMATAMALALYFIFAKRVYSKQSHLLLSFFCASWIGMISFSRIYLDVHWLSDVIAGIGLGLFWVTFVVLIQRRV